MLNSAVEYINKCTNNFKPEIGIILGSGLGELADEYCQQAISYAEIPGFEASTVSGHKGRLVFAEINNKKVVMMQGRFHFYEGHSIQKVVFPIKVMKKLGVKTIIVTNAAGGVNADFKPSDLMIITDHINFMGVNPLIGLNDDTMGERFPDMSNVYSLKLRETAKKCASEINMNLKEGVYLATTGPSYETAAEIKAFSILGADVVGMSSVPEAIVSNYLKMDTLAFSIVTNHATGISENKLSHKEVLETGKKASLKLSSLINKIIKNI